MNRPTPLFVLVITTIALTVFSLWIIATLHSAAINRRAEAILNPPMCITETGQDIPCPQGENQ